MKKRLVHTENILKDKIQGHEFPFDPDAWSSMQHLLDQSDIPDESISGSGTPSPKRWGAASITRWIGYFTVFSILFVSIKYYTGEAHAETNTAHGLSKEESSLVNQQKLHGGHSIEKESKNQDNTRLTINEDKSLKDETNETKRVTKDGALSEIHLKKDSRSAFMGLTEDSDHPGAEKEDTKHHSAFLYHLLGVKPQHSTFESVDDFFVPEDAVQAPMNILGTYKEEFVPELYKTEKNRSRSILLPEIESWQERAKKAKPAIPLKSPQAAIFKKTGKQIQLGIMLGGQAMSLERSRRDTRLQPTIGVSVSAPLTKRLSAEIDFMWKNVGGYHFYASFVDSGYARGGYSRWEYSVASEKINFFEIPIAVKYSTAHQKQNLLAGVRLSRVRPNDYIQYFSSSNSLQPMEDYLGDIGNGFRRWDAALFLGADVRLWKNLWLDIRYSKGIHDLTDNTYFKNTRADIASDAQITLKYNFARLRFPSR